jgi:hypothetical protein
MGGKRDKEKEKKKEKKKTKNDLIDSAGDKRWTREMTSAVRGTARRSSEPFVCRSEFAG